jgi:23S rRNA pseudouridine1911/1915/1917 synthase
MSGEPDRHGGGRAAETVPAALAGERVDRVVALLTGVTRAEAAELVATGRVRVGGAVVAVRSRRVAAGDELVVELRPPPHAVLEPDPDVPVEVVFADDHVIVVDKAPGVVVHPGAGQAGGTLVHGLLARFPDLAGLGELTEGGDARRPGIVHRLDKGTSGLLVVARTPAAAASLVAQLGARTVGRRYDALAWGRFDAGGGLIDAPIGRSDADPTRMAVVASGREARTRYQVTATYEHPDRVTRLACQLETGRTHQIRVHLAAIGHPVVGDDRYGGAHGPIACPRPFLHAASLSFVHPATGQTVSFDSPLPGDLAAVLASLR